MRRIPVIGPVYSGAKTFSETVLTDKGSSFKQVVMVEFPRKGVFSIGFITSEDLEEVQARTAQDVTCVFVPTTPNPTTGFMILVPRDEVVRLDMTVDEAFKMLLTLGRGRPEMAQQALRRSSCAAADRTVTFGAPPPVRLFRCPCELTTAARSTSTSSVPRSPSRAGSTGAVTTAA